MASHTTTPTEAPLDLSKWRSVPTKLAIAGAIMAAIGAFAITPSGGQAVPLIKQASFSYLTAYIFCLSFMLGGLFLTILHHLFRQSGRSAGHRLPAHPWSRIGLGFHRSLSVDDPCRP
jgi:hypothetical protein